MRATNGKRIITVVAAMGLLLAGCGSDGDELVTEAVAAEKPGAAGKGKDRGAQPPDAAAAAEKRAEQAEKRAARAERKAEKAAAKAAEAQTAKQEAVDDEAVRQQMQDPEVQKLVLDVGWESATQADRDNLCSGWVMKGEVRELMLDAMIEAADGVIDRDIAKAYFDEKCQ